MKNEYKNALPKLFNGRTLILVFMITSFVGCDNDDNHQNNNFYDSDYRIGLWINTDRNDTLDFVDNINMIRKGDVYNYEEYIYRIEGESLFIGLPNSSIETQHQILNVENNRVVLGNMYPTIQFLDGSGTFIKQSKN
jgi:hypothetical protein